MEFGKTSLRDLMAIQAMNALIRHGGVGRSATEPNTKKAIAKEAYEMADLMGEERVKK